MKKTHKSIKVILGVLAMSAFIFSFSGCNNGTPDTGDGDSDPIGNGGGTNTKTPDNTNTDNPNQDNPTTTDYDVIDIEASYDNWITLDKPITAKSGYTTINAEWKFESKEGKAAYLQLMKGEDTQSSNGVGCTTDFSITSANCLSGSSYIRYFTGGNEHASCADEADRIQLAIQDSEYHTVTGKIYIKKIWLSGYGKENLIIYKAKGADDTTPPAYKTTNATYSYKDDETSFEITTNVDGTFTSTYDGNPSGTYLIKDDLLKIYFEDEIHYFRILENNKIEIYSLDLTKATFGYGGDAKEIKDGKLVITNNSKDSYFQLAFPYIPELADGAAYIYSKVDPTGTSIYANVGLTDAEWKSTDCPVTIEKPLGLYNYEKGIYYSFIAINAGGWVGTLTIDKICIGQKYNKEDVPSPQPNESDDVKNDPFKITYNENQKYAAVLFSVEDDWKSLEVIFADDTNFDNIQFNVLCDTVQSEEDWGLAYYTTYPQIVQAKNTLDLAIELNALKINSNNAKTKLTAIKIQNSTEQGFSVDVVSAKVTKTDGTVVSVKPVVDWGASLN